MKYAIIIQVPEPLMKDTEAFGSYIKNEIIFEKMDLLKESKRFMNFKVSIGHKGDDFIYNRASVYITGQVYKLSRMIKNRLIKHSKR